MICNERHDLVKQWADLLPLADINFTKYEYHFRADVHELDGGQFYSLGFGCWVDIKGWKHRSTQSILVRYEKEL